MTATKQFCWPFGFSKLIRQRGKFAVAEIMETRSPENCMFASP
jgi:hypothetical protein